MLSLSKGKVLRGPKGNPGSSTFCGSLPLSADRTGLPGGACGLGGGDAALEFASGDAITSGGIRSSGEYINRHTIQCMAF